MNLKKARLCDLISETRLHAVITFTLISKGPSSTQEEYAFIYCLKLASKTQTELERQTHHVVNAALVMR